jgi:predicted transcriptional regulator
LIQKVKHLKEKKNLSITDISKLNEVSCPTVYKVLKEHLGYVSNRLVQPEETNEQK